MKIAINTGSPGLANRIKTYVSCFSKFDEVRTIKDADTYIFDNIKLATDEELKSNPHFDHWRFSIEENEKKYLVDYKYIDLLYEKTNMYFVDKYRSVFSKLKINQEILNYVDEFTKDWSNIIGLHIRSWYCDRNKWHSNELFEQAIDQLDSSKKIFLCGDNDIVLKHFEDRYGDRIITHDQERFSHPHLAESGHNVSVQTNVDAFIDLMILSRCDTIVGTYASTFTEVAWWFGECKPNVIIPEPPNVDEDFKNRIFERI